MEPNWKPVRKTATEKRSAQLAKWTARKRPPTRMALTSDRRTDRRVRKAIAAAEQRAHIAAVRRQVFAASSRCAFCGETERESARRQPISRHQLHEWPSRAQTRGRPLAERFSVQVCARVCAACHRLATDHVIWPMFASREAGWTGDYEVVHRDMRVVARRVHGDVEVVEPVGSW